MRRGGFKRAAALFVIGTSTALWGGSPVSGQAEASVELTGLWSGSLEIMGLELPFSLNFFREADTLSATMEAQGMTDLELSGVSHRGKELRFQRNGPAGVLSFAGVVDGDSITGSVVQGSATGVFALRRQEPVHLPRYGAVGREKRRTVVSEVPKRTTVRSVSSRAGPSACLREHCADHSGFWRTGKRAMAASSSSTSSFCLPLGTHPTRFPWSCSQAGQEEPRLRWLRLWAFSSRICERISTSSSWTSEGQAVRIPSSVPTVPSMQWLGLYSKWISTEPRSRRAARGWTPTLRGIRRRSPQTTSWRWFEPWGTRGPTCSGCRTGHGWPWF